MNRSVILYPMMSKWRCRQWIVLAFVALLACASPSLLWACSSAQCVGESSANTTHGKIAILSTAPCPDADCLDLRAPCCQPLPVTPNHSNAPATPAKSAHSLDASTSLSTTSSADSISAVALLDAPVWEPLAGHVPIVSRACCPPSHNSQSPPLPGRSPPIF